ncbi:M48 family metallopeptidase [Inhella sp.]|uniref:M48 family metallopeptidase n=1 Tax=Inhella sp. TaxID=1921806 RepID=UPI0035AFBA5F
MLTPPLVSATFVAVLLVTFLLKFWLLQRQMRHVAAHRAVVPPAFAATVSLAAHQKAADYTMAKGRLALFSQLLSTALLVGWTLLGGLDALSAWVQGMVGAQTWGGYAQALVLVGAFALIGMVLDLPLEAYATFGVEQRFGFNHSSVGLFAVDLLKGVGVAVVIGTPLLWGVLALMREAGTAWWLWAWILWIGFQLLVMWLYPLVIAPLFNKFEPLNDEGLVQRVQSLFQRAGFSAAGLFVMDGSRRSAHGNAYFTGWGRAKRVVFFDTLLSRLQPPEVEAVLAHELGHFKLKHVPKRLVQFALVSLAGFALLGWLAQQPAFYLGLGVRPSLVEGNDLNNALALMLFLMTVPMLAYPLAPLFSAASRKHEFEADAYACAQADGQALAEALLKLHEDNASTLTPDPVYARWTYSHPPAVERLAAIRAQLNPQPVARPA